MYYKETNMNRRTFLARSTGAMALPMLLNGLPVKAFDGPVLHRLLNGGEETDHVLVLVQLIGGNDGLNTVLPLDQYDAYTRLRSNIAIPESAALKLTDTTALHPVMTGLRDLFQEKKVALVQGVGYPNPNLSHFRSTDIWMSGSDADKVVANGWLGRYLGGSYPDYPAGYPNASTPDPLAIQISAVVSLALTGLNQQSMGIALQDPQTFYQLVSGTEAPGSDLPSEPYARTNVEYVRQVQSQSMAYSTVIKAAADKAQNKVEYPSQNQLASQLQIVARMIAGGLKTRVYVVTLGGFDTHAAQVVDGATTTGTHATLLTTVSDAMTAFQRDIEALGVQDRVVSMTFSEFGRRVASNLSLGTDHGTAAPMFVVGAPVQDGIVGVNPDLGDLDNDNLKMQIDFRQVYASVLEQWFGADPAAVRSILFHDFATVPIIRRMPTSVDDVSSSAFGINAIAPNPVRGTVNIRYLVNEAMDMHLAVYDNLGFHVATLVKGYVAPGSYTVPFHAEGLPSGSYLVRMGYGDRYRTWPLVVVK